MSTTTHTITFACSHQDRVQVTWHGNATTRDRAIAYRAMDLCPDCADAERIARGQAAQDAGMVGSAKQCAWATDIQRNARSTWASMAHGATPDQAEAADAMLANTDAKWWIDNRHHLTSLLTGRITVSDLVGSVLTGRPL